MTPFEFEGQKNKIWQEWLDYSNNEVFNLSNIDKDFICNWWFEKIDSALKQQREEMCEILIEELEKNKAFEGYERNPNNMQMLHENRLFNSAIEICRSIIIKNIQG